MHNRLYHILSKESKRKKNFIKQPNLISLKFIKKLIGDIENSQPIGVIQIIALSKALNLQIRIKNPKNNIDFKIGKSQISPIEIEYNDGHWSLKNGKNVNFCGTWKNNCCFEAIAGQINLSPQEICKKTINEMRNNEYYYARIIDKIMHIKNWQIVLNSMIGGARYMGNSASEARRVIDNSQNGRCSHNGLKGHPRGHASYPNANGSDDSVENYSRGGWKTGFLSRNDQDFVGNLAFNTRDAQRAMERLNDGSSDEAVHLSIRDLGKDDLPKASDFRYGRADGSPRNISSLTIVLRHHMGSQNDRMADVFIHTFYPRL